MDNPTVGQYSRNRESLKPTFYTSALLAIVSLLSIGTTTYAFFSLRGNWPQRLFPCMEAVWVAEQLDKKPLVDNTQEQRLYKLDQLCQESGLELYSAVSLSLPLNTAKVEFAELGQFWQNHEEPNPKRLNFLVRQAELFLFRLKERDSKWDKTAKLLKRLYITSDSMLEQARILQENPTSENAKTFEQSMGLATELLQELTLEIAHKEGINLTTLQEISLESTMRTELQEIHNLQIPQGKELKIFLDEEPSRIRTFQTAKKLIIFFSPLSISLLGAFLVSFINFKGSCDLTLPRQMCTVLLPEEVNAHLEDEWRHLEKNENSSDLEKKIEIFQHFLSALWAFKVQIYFDNFFVFKQSQNQ